MLLRGEWVTLVQIVLVLDFRYATSATAGLFPALSGNLTERLGYRGSIGQCGVVA